VAGWRSYFSGLRRSLDHKVATCITPEAGDRWLNFRLTTLSVQAALYSSGRGHLDRLFEVWAFVPDRETVEPCRLGNLSRTSCDLGIRMPASIEVVDPRLAPSGPLQASLVSPLQPVDLGRPPAFLLCTPMRPRTEGFRGSRSCS